MHRAAACLSCRAADAERARSALRYGAIRFSSREDGQIRVTPTGQPSVFDMIKVLGGRKNPHQAWLRLTESHPEVVPKCENLRFPGRGQRETPVVKGKEAAYCILGLLPGAAGKPRSCAKSILAQGVCPAAASTRSLTAAGDEILL